ncbi:Imm32 family immunity protein [Dactylosporangium sp. CA-152071]|uniref:Imm32 family immunity protein n=1 Tax=Dactylosporangium sp. CA-152071 TaxID=3239933 RepID=UPI003D8E1E69
MAEISLSVPRYDSTRGVVAPVEGGTVIVEVVDGSVEIFGDPAGLRDLARWCLALADENAPSGSHIHLNPGTVPLALESASLMLARQPTR